MNASNILAKIMKLLLLTLLSLWIPYSLGTDEVLNIDGSDSLAPLIRLNIPDWMSLNGGVLVSISSNGTSVGFSKLAKGDIAVATASREMTDKELQKYQRLRDSVPFFVKVAVDGVSVIVHKSNPITGIKFEQFGQIYSSKGGCDSEKSIRDWSELGIPFRGKVIPYSRDPSSGTFGYVSRKVLCHEPILHTVQMLGSHKEIVETVVNRELSIGYVSMNWQSEDVKTLPVWSPKVNRYVYVDEASINSGDYPLSRFLYMYANLNDKGTLPDVVASLFQVLLSNEGQERVEELGYAKLSSEAINKQKNKLNFLLQ